MAGTKLRWVNGLSQLADSLTKANAKKTLLHLTSVFIWKTILVPCPQSEMRVGLKSS
jgi:hypothetical protein